MWVIFFQVSNKTLEHLNYIIIDENLKYSPNKKMASTFTAEAIINLYIKLVISLQ